MRSREMKDSSMRRPAFPQYASEPFQSRCTTVGCGFAGKQELNLCLELIPDGGTTCLVGALDCV